MKVVVGMGERYAPLELSGVDEHALMMNRREASNTMIFDGV